MKENPRDPVEYAIRVLQKTVDSITNSNPAVADIDMEPIAQKVWDIATSYFPDNPAQIECLFARIALTAAAYTLAHHVSIVPGDGMLECSKCRARVSSGGARRNEDGSWDQKSLICPLCMEVQKGGTYGA